MSLDRPVLSIGIDGLPWSLLDRLFEGGYMPALHELASTGATGTLRSTLPAITPAAWGTFQTGVNPGRNGVFSFRAWDPETKEYTSSNSSSLEPTLWEYVSAAGGTVGVINVPMTYPPREINGFVVSGILTPSLDADFTHPPGLKQELLSEIPEYHIFTTENVKDVSPHDDFKGFVDEMADIVRMRSEAAQYLLNSRDTPDVFMTHFQASDVAQHTLWPYIDPDHSLNLYDDSKADYFFEQFYQVLDEQIATLIRTFTDETDSKPLVLVLSDHGFQAHEKRFNLGNWLVEEGYLVTNDAGFETPTTVSLLQQLDIKGRVRKLVPWAIQRRIRDAASQVEGQPDPYDWETSSAYAFGRSNEGFIYFLEDVNEQVAARLIEHLQQITDPETGKAVVSTVHRKEDIYTGDTPRTLPDLVIEPESGYSFTGGYLPDKGLFHAVLPDEDFHLGKHHSDGIVIFNGSGVQNIGNIDCSIVDLIPTLLHFVGVRPRRELDGEIRDDIFDKTVKGAKSEIRVSNNYSEHKLSEKEQENIEDRLDHLGYK